jgi:hypothetical protein
MAFQCKACGLQNEGKASSRLKESLLIYKADADEGSLIYSFKEN